MDLQAVVGGAGVTPRHVVLNVDTDDKLFGLPTSNIALILVVSLYYICCIIFEHKIL